MGLRYVLLRVAASAGMAVAATLVVFLVAHTVPADPVLAQLGQLVGVDREAQRSQPVAEQSAQSAEDPLRHRQDSLPV